MNPDHNTNFESATNNNSLAKGSIVISNVEKNFRKHTLLKKSYSSIKTTLLSRLFSKRYPRDNFLYALKGISINVPAGKSVGIIGSNGSGKSTLLKLISGIYQPDKGEIKVNGRISALIELGAGFHPDFSGRENIYLGGVMYGLSKKQIAERFESIVKYAELEDFIDDPVKTYSSGMYMRLGFSLAIHTDPDILLVDEVLAVGDASFVSRCKETISEFKRQGKTLILVTHDLDSVSRWCDEAIWLEKGVIREQGEPQLVIDRYLEQVKQKEEKHLQDSNVESAKEDEFRIETVEEVGDKNLEQGSNAKRWGNRDVEILSVRMIDRAGEAKWVFNSSDSVDLEVSYSINKEVKDLVFGIGILRADGLVVHGTNTDIDDVKVPLSKNTFPVKGVYRFRISRLGLVEGSYYLDAAAHRSDGFPYDYHHLRYRFSVRNSKNHQGIVALEHTWEFIK